MQNQVIKCPYCKKDIPLTEALSKQLRDEINKEYEEKFQKKEQEISVKEETISDKEKELDEAKKLLDGQVEKKVKEATEEIEKKAKQNAEENISIELKDLNNQLKEKGEKLKEAEGKELQLMKERRELEESKEKLKLEVARKVDEEREQIKISAIASAEEEYKLKVKDKDKKLELSKGEIETRDKENKELQEQTKELLKQIRETKGAKDKLEIEYQKKLLEDEDKIKQDAKKEARDELSFKIAEKDKKLADADKQIKDLQRSLQQGSQQLQGEVQELVIEDILKKAFPFDDIKEVPKGIKGADVVHGVCNNSGTICGTIVWESKNTKTWQPPWIQKLKEDRRSLKAEVAVLVSKFLPESIKNLGLKDDVYICDMESAVGLAFALREQLINVHAVCVANRGKANKAEIVYNYLISNDFKQRIEVWVEYFRNRKDEIDKERAYFNKKWEKEGKSILRVIENTAGIYGDLQGFSDNALPKVPYLELPEDISNN